MLAPSTLKTSLNHPTCIFIFITNKQTDRLNFSSHIHPLIHKSTCIIIFLLISSPFQNQFATAIHPSLHHRTCVFISKAIPSSLPIHSRSPNLFCVLCCAIHTRPSLHHHAFTSVFKRIKSPFQIHFTTTYSSLTPLSYVEFHFCCQTLVNRISTLRSIIERAFTFL